MSNASDAVERNGVAHDVNREVGEFWQRIRKEIEDFFVEIGATERKISKEFAPFRFIRRVWPADAPSTFSYAHYDPAKPNAVLSNGGIAGTLYDEVERHERPSGLARAYRAVPHAYVVQTVASTRGDALPDLEIWPVRLHNARLLVKEPLPIVQQALTDDSISGDVAGQRANTLMFWIPIYEFMRDEGFAGSFLGWLCQVAIGSCDSHGELCDRIMERVRKPKGPYRKYVMSWKKAKGFSAQIQELALDEIRLAEVDPLENPIDFIVRNLHFIHPMQRAGEGGELTIELPPSPELNDPGGTIHLSPCVQSDFIAPWNEQTRERFEGDVQVLYQRLYREVALRVGYARSLLREALARAEETVLREELHLLKNAFQGLARRENALAEHLRDDPATRQAVAEQRATYALCAFGLRLKQAARQTVERWPSGTVRLDRLASAALPHAMLLVRGLPREFVEGPFLGDYAALAERLAGIDKLEEHFWPAELAAADLVPAYDAFVSAVAVRGPTLIWGDTGGCSVSGTSRDFMHLYEILLEILLNAFKRNATSVMLSHDGNRTLVIRSSNSDDLSREERELGWEKVAENAVGGFALLRNRAEALGGSYQVARRSRVVMNGGAARDLFVRWDRVGLGRLSLQCEQSEHEAPSISPSR